MSSTSPGMSPNPPGVTPWRTRSIGKSAARSSGPTGCSVPGCSGGGGGLGRSGTTLYHCVGSCDSSSRILVCAVPAMAFPPPRVAASLVERPPCPPPLAGSRRGPAGGPSVGVEGGVELAPAALAGDDLERTGHAVAAEQQLVSAGQLQRLDHRAVGERHSGAGGHVAAGLDDG